MPIEILMPALSPTMEKGTLARWHVKEGDKVAPGDVVAEIETDKATMEVESVDEGTVAAILVAEGTADVPVNTVIATLEGEGAPAKARSAGIPTTSVPPSPVTGAPATIPGGGATPSQPAPGGGAAPSQPAPGATPSPPVPAPAPVPPIPGIGIPTTSVPPSQTTGNPAVFGRATGARVFASPLARRVAREKGIDIAAVGGSGPRGRIVLADVEAAIAGGLAAAPKPVAVPAAAPAALAAGPSSAEVKAAFAGADYETIPHDTMRKVIARRLTESKQTVPHFYLTIDCRIDALLAARGEINAGAPKDADGKPRFKLSVNDFIVKALGLALRDVPDANVTWTEEALLRHRRADVGVAVAIPGGLITPVVRGVEGKSLSAISAEVKDFATRARARKLLPEEYTGGATTISNLGMYGIREFAAVINPPHATILAVGAGEERAIVENGAIVVANMMTVTLSTDHRAVDGALGAELLAAFKRYIERPVTMLV